jgi:hypothetical protein
MKLCGSSGWAATAGTASATSGAARPAFAPTGTGPLLNAAADDVILAS